MAQDPLIEKLSKANGNIKKLSEFFAARRDWHLAADAGQSALDLTTAATGVDEHLKMLLAKCGSEPVPAAQPAVEPVAAGLFDDSRLKRFGAFLRDLDSWFGAQSCPTDCPEGITALQEMEANLACLVGLMETVITSQPEVAPPNLPMPDAGAETPDPSLDDGKATEPEIPDDVPRQLVLDDTDEEPMVQEFQGITELTQECQDQVDSFLAAWGIEYSYYNRKKLLERLLRWISSAPDGQVLVIKMKTAEEPFEPYPNYVSRDVLAGREPPQDL